MSKRSAAGENENLMAPASTREVIIYDIPKELAPEATTASFGEIAAVGIVLLTPQEEKTAASRTKGDAMQLAYELTQMSLAEYTPAGPNARAQQVHSHDGSREKLWGELHPKIRNILMQAYSEESVASQAATTAFLKSRRIKA